ncbi:YajQ family cyclic di-GMP-binding protein [Shewanella sp. WXL01]|uniref:Nucleotide-binding protein EXU30_05955 n=1 Tax=Shewanella maritima TaxID=2520507 RepID=A0A411PFQ2_9GAMM|nr:MULTISPECIES: YajQ family cyclic di-GMP-binding protein [Shewanella]NKF49610.1 YajQ family cyclic di-GMP-binding protein [Shewanella sp. WXL01]QBF82294.1 YajQ family cyclic di-GMP-binding protein [Shewanella maritima]
MPSMDIVSEVDAVELRNAVDNTRREIDNRYDFRGKNVSVEFKDMQVTLSADDEYYCKQMVDVLRMNLSKRNVDPAVMEVDEKALHTGKTFSLRVRFMEGIETDVAKKLVKVIKDSKMKVQCAIQGDTVRVTGKKRDDLQAAIRLARESELGQPFQIKNLRD